MAESIEYSEKYDDKVFEYRHVILPRELAKRLPQPLRLLKEDEWRRLGVQQSRGWEHYEIHKPEPHILLFRRLVGTDPQTGQLAVAATKHAWSPCRLNVEIISIIILGSPYPFQTLNSCDSSIHYGIDEFKKETQLYCSICLQRSYNVHTRDTKCSLAPIDITHSLDPCRDAS